MQNMWAARYLEPHRIEAVETPIPSVREEEALIHVDACGFCGSDIGIISGVHPRARAPLTIGHEFSGRVVAVQSQSGEFQLGDNVTLFPLISCGTCFVCRHGNPHVCRTLRLYGFDADGGMAEYARIPLKNLIKLPQNMPALLGAMIEPLAVAVHAVGRTALNDVRTTVVMGAGPIGILTALVARAKGLEVVISDIAPFRLKLASGLGLTAVPATDLRRFVDEKTSLEGADLVFECAGAAASALEMTALLRPRGSIVNVSVFKKPPTVDMQAVNFKELTIIGSRVYTRQDFVEAVELAASLPLERIVTHSFPLAEVGSAYARFKAGDGVCKVLVLPTAAN